jgi:hypothetical protein
VNKIIHKEIDQMARGVPQKIASKVEISGNARGLLLDTDTWLEFDDMSMEADTMLVLGTKHDHLTLNFG